MTAPQIAEQLHSTMDAKVWAEEFARLFLRDRHGPDCQCGEDSRGYIDDELMYGWFANTIMCGYDHATNRLKARIEKLEAALRHIADTKSCRDCCKFAVLKGYRRRHLKEVAAEALDDAEAGK
jgi:hypothetical protein